MQMSQQQQYIGFLFSSSAELGEEVALVERGLLALVSMLHSRHSRTEC